MTWYHVNHPAHEGPNHWGWSRMVTESYKAKKYGKLLSASKHTKGRNSNEQGSLLKGLKTTVQVDGTRFTEIRAI